MARWQASGRVYSPRVYGTRVFRGSSFVNVAVQRIVLMGTSMKRLILRGR